MLVILLIFASLCNLANGGAAAIDVCSMPVLVPPQGAGAGAGPAANPGAAAAGNPGAAAAGQQRFVQRPTVPVDNCHDRDPAACFEIFKHDPGDVQVPVDNLMP